MNGLVGLKGVLIIAAAIVLFGGAVYDMTTTGVECGIGMLNRGNYTCEEFGLSAGSTIVFPDRNIEGGVDSILKLREFRASDPEGFGELSSVIDTNEQNYRNQVLLGLAGLLVVMGAMAWMLFRLAPSAEWDLGGKMLVVLAAVVLYGVIYMLFTGFAQGDLRLPFSGLASLIAHPEVLSSLGVPGI